MVRSVFFLFILFLSISPCFGDLSWPDAIKNVEKLRDSYIEKASKMGSNSLGTFYAHLGVKEHYCSILGRMLDRKKYIEHLEEKQPGSSATEYQYRAAAVSLSNWINQAYYLISITERKKKILWNLNCVGKLKIPKHAYISTGAEREFYQISDDRKTLHVIGDITVGFYGRFARVLKQYSEINTIALGSRGGSVWDAIQAGIEIRKRKIDTVLWDECYSACPLLFFAGVNRSIPPPYYKLGFHQVSLDGRALSKKHAIYKKLREYSKLMGVNAGMAISFMLRAKPNDIHKPNLHLLCRSKIVTSSKYVC